MLITDDAGSRATWNRGTQGTVALRRGRVAGRTTDHLMSNMAGRVRSDN